MKIYNTLSRRKEEFKPIEEGKISMYVCGPTVYNLIHIGNARPMIVFDTFRRYMTHKGYEVNYVSNFTDVENNIHKAIPLEGMFPASGTKVSVRCAVYLHRFTPRSHCANNPQISRRPEPGDRRRPASRSR